MVGGEDIRKSEGKPPQGLEILDAEKLGKYGALYGRFLLASQAQPGEIANILDPDKSVEFNLATATLKKRNYNPISENLSFKERQEEWKEAPSFADAYREWKTKFTSFMTKITDPKREFILSMIMHDSKKATDFNETDADRLFNDFCKGKSDVTAFIDRVTASLVNPDSDGKIDPITIQSVLPHIEWIASGLFGKKTASQVVTRLIELESALHNNTEQVIGIFNSDKLGRINMLTDGERGVLGDLHSLIPQAKDVTPKPTVPAVSVTEPAKGKDEILSSASTTTVPESAPVIAKPEKTKREIDDELIKLLLSEEGEDSPPATPIPPAESVSEPKPETPHQPVIEEVPIEGSYRIRLKVNGTDLGFEFRKPLINGDYSFRLGDQQTEYLDIPEGIIVSVDVDDAGITSAKKITIIGGKGTRLNLKDLNSLGITSDSRVSILTPKYAGWKTRGAIIAGHEGKASFNGIYEEPRSWMSMGDLEKYLKARNEEIKKIEEQIRQGSVNPAGPKPEEATAGENIINAVNIKDSEFSLPEKFLKDQLQGSDQNHLVFSLSYNQLKEYMNPVIKGYSVYLRLYLKEADEPKNMITIPDVEIDQGFRETWLQKAVLGGAKFDLIITNSADGITADIQNYHANLSAQIFGRRIKDSFKDIDRIMKERLNKQIATDNPAWLVTNISIKDGKFLIRFEKTPQTV